MIGPNGNGKNGPEPETMPLSATASPDDESPIARARVAKLKPKQERAAWALACGDKQHEAAHKAGVHLRTLQRWMDSEAFMDVVADGSRLILSFNAPAEAAARSIVSQAAPTAARELVDLVASDDEDMRFRASSKVLECVGVGGKGATVAVQVNVSQDGEHLTAQERAEAILARQAEADA